MIFKNLFKTAIFILSRPPRGVAEMKIGEEEARFFARDYEQLRYIRRFSDEKGVNEARILELLLEVLGPKDVVYDIGANIGIHTVFLAKRVGRSGRVVSFEPDAAIADILEGHVRLNGLENVKVVRLALGNRDYLGDLFVDRRIGRGTTSLVETEGKTISGKAHIVQGDSFVADQGLPIPKAVKIDVEGYEIEVLEGMKVTLRDPGCAYLCCEIHPALLPNGRTENDVVRLVEELGFMPMCSYPRGQEVHTIFRKAKA